MLALRSCDLWSCGYDFVLVTEGSIVQFPCFAPKMCVLPAARLRSGCALARLRAPPAWGRPPPPLAPAGPQPVLALSFNTQANPFALRLSHLPICILLLLRRCSVDVPLMFRRCSVDVSSMFRRCFVDVLDPSPPSASLGLESSGDRRGWPAQSTAA